MAFSASSGRPGDNGFHDRGMLRHGRGGASGNQDRAVLVAHGLGAQGADEAEGRTVPRELEQRRVQVRVRFRRSQQVAEFEQLALARETCLNARDTGFVDPLRGLADREPFENGAGLQNLDRFVVADSPHARATMRFANDEPFLLEANERRSYLAARHLERGADVRLHEPCFGRDVAVNDGIPKRVVVRGDSHCRHAYCRNVAKIVNNSV